LKRIIALITVFVFAVALAGMVYAQVDTRTPAEKLAAGRAYLKLLDQKIIKYRKLGNAAMVTRLRGEKVSLISRMKGWKAEVEAAAAPPAPPAPPVVAPPPPPPPVVVAPPPPAAAGLFGLGVNTSGSLGYITATEKTSTLTVRGDIMVPDFLQLGPMMGLAADAIGFKFGVGYMDGKDINENQWRAIPIFADGIINFPADLMGGVESYLGGGLNYPISGEKTGNVGGQVYYGIQGDLGLGIGKTYGEIGWQIIHTTTDSKFARSSKGLSIQIGQQIML
jgi:hypothetical protein